MTEKFEKRNLANEKTRLLKKNIYSNVSNSETKEFHRCYGKRQILVDLLAIFFGVGAWVGVNGMFVELPLIVEQAPESWKLPSYMTITVQIANLGPIIYVLLRKCTVHIFSEVYFIYSLQLIGCTALILTAFLYDVTTEIGGENHSTVFLILLFFTSIVGCTSPLLFFPFMRHFKEIYLVSYFIGEGLGGFSTSTVALIQGIGDNTYCFNTLNQTNGTEFDSFHRQGPLLSIQTFFLFTFLMMCGSLVSFILLNQMKLCKNELVTTVEQHELTINLDNTKPDNIHTAIKPLNDNVIIMPAMIPQYKAVLLLVLAGTICIFSNGVFPALQSYSCLPYGNTAYHLSVSLSTMANPLACFLALFLPHASKQLIAILTMISSVLTVYLIMTAVWSLSPPLAETTIGIIVVILSWTFVVGINSFIKLYITTTIRSMGDSWMFYCGVATQSGSALGSLASFLLIVYTNIFTMVDPCK